MDVAALVLLGTLGCGTAAADAEMPDVVTDAGAAPPQEDGGLPDATILVCDRAAPVTLWVTTDGGYPSRLHVPVTVDQTKGVLLFDTGSTATFLSTPVGTHDPSMDAGTLTVGTCAEEVIGRPYASEDARGLPGLGFFGVDQIVMAPRTSLDLSRGVLTRFIAGGGPKTDRWPATTLEVVAESLLVRITLAGKRVRLLVDTGSPDILWLGQASEPGDVEEKVVDAAGQVLSVFRGDVDAELTTGMPEKLPIIRAPSFPYLESRRPEFGGELDGLLGLSALGAREVLFDRAQGLLYRAP